jgi:tetratricopeptide (TPR) repeat protein
MSAQPPPPARPSIPGYELCEAIGLGGMGVVYRARDLRLGRDVAVKLLADRFAAGSAAARRFVDEAGITARLQHPGIPPVYAVGEAADGRPFLALKLIAGDTLAALLDRGDPFDPVGVFLAVAQAVGYAHAEGVVHRDLKPQNVMVGAFGEVQVLDWGLAKVLAGRSRGGTGLDPGDGPLGHRGGVMGTPAYMPPEQAAGRSDEVGPASDVFGLGAILCVLLTGRPPFDGASVGTLLTTAAAGRTADALARLDACGADPALVELCKHCLAVRPVDRPPDAAAVAAAVVGLRAAADERARRAAAEAAAERVRRRVQLRLGGLAAAVLLAGTTGTSVGLRRADAARRAAEAATREAAARQAEAEAARAAEGVARKAAEAAGAVAVARAEEVEAVLRFVIDGVFAVARPAAPLGGLGPGVTVRQAVAASLPTVADRFRGRPLLEAGLRRALGDTCRSFDDHEAAAGQYELAVKTYAGRLGEDHPTTADAMSRLSDCYILTGRLNDSCRLLKQVLDGRRRRLGPHHPDVLSGTERLADRFAAAGRLPEALAAQEDHYLGCRAAFGPDHPATIRAGLGYARRLTQLGRWSQALPFAADVAERSAVDTDRAEAVGLLFDIGRHFRGLGDPAGCRAVAAVWEQLSAGRPDRLYWAAAARAVAAEAYTRAGRAADAAADADRAMGLLARAAAGGGVHRQRLITDADLAAVRGRADFQALLAGVPEQAPSPRPGR